MAWIQKVTNPRTFWRVRWYEADGTERSKAFDTHRAAKDYRAELERGQSRGEYVDPREGRITVGEWHSQLDASRIGVMESTAAWKGSLWRSHVEPAFGALRLCDVTQPAVQAWVTELASRRQPWTVRHAYQQLRSLLDAAVDAGKLASTPCRGIVLPRIESRDMRVLSIEEVDALASVLDGRYRAMVVLAAYTGLRFGEVCGVRASRLDMLRGRLQVVEAMVWVRGRPGLASPKTKASRRTVKLPGFVVDELAAHMAAYPAGGGGLVFTSERGGMIRKDNFRRRVWLPAVEASVGEPCRFHDLRHTHAAWLIEQGEHSKAIQARLGHASIRTTLDTYGHLIDSMDEDLADRLDVRARVSRESGAAFLRHSGEVVNLGD